jgi:CRP-like cAMP-binding protein
LAAQEPEAIVVGEMNLLGVSTHSSVTLRAVTTCIVRRLGHSRFMEVLSRSPGDLNNLGPLLELQHTAIYPPLDSFPLEVRNVGLAGASEAFWKFLLAHVEERIFCAGQRVTLDDQHKNIPGKMPKNMSFCRLNRGSIQVFPDPGVRAWRSKASKDSAEEITEGEFIHGDVFCDAKILQAREACYVSVLHRGVIARAFEELPEDRAELLNTVAGESPRAPKNSASILRERSIFSGASPEFIRALEAKAQVRVYMPGDRIIRQTDEGAAMYILWVGSASVVHETEGVVDGQRTRSLSHIGILIHGAVFGELAMLGQRRVSGVIASTVCCCWEVSFHIVRDILQGHPAERASFLGMVEQHLEKFGNQQVGDSPLFADFSQHFRTFIGVNSEKHLYFEGQTILQEGAVGDRLFIVNLGTARVEAMGQRLPSPRGSGAHFGYGMLCRSSSLAKEKYHVSVTAETMCQVFVVTRAAFQAALKKYPDMREVARALEAKEAHEERMQREQANLLAKQQAQRSRYLHSFIQACARLFDYNLGEESSARRRVTYLYFDAFRRVVAKIIEDRAVAEQTRQAGLQQIARWISRRNEQLEQVKQQKAMNTLVFQNVSQRGPLAMPKGGSQKRAQSRQGLSQLWDDARSPYLSPNPQWKQAPAMERVTLPSLPLFSPLLTPSPRGSLSARPNTAPAQDVVQPVLRCGNPKNLCAPYLAAASAKLAPSSPPRPAGPPGDRMPKARCRRPPRRHCDGNGKAS